MHGGGGRDRLFGYGGDDRFFAAGDDAVDEVIGGKGSGDRAHVDASDILASVEITS
jgi:hypothetical protein